MLSHSLFDDFCDVAQRRSQLLHLEVTQRDVVGQLAIVAQGVHGFRKLLPGVFVLTLFVEDTTLVDNDVRVVLTAYVPSLSTLP